MMLNVDDIGMLIPRDCIEYNRVKNILENEYEKMRVQEEVFVTYMGLEIERDWENKTFRTSTKRRVGKACTDLSISPSSKQIKNPFRTHPKGTQSYGDIKQYKSFVMTIFYMTSMYHAMLLATKQSCPFVLDWKKEE